MSSPLLPSPCTSETHVPPVLTGHFSSPLGTTVNSGFTVPSLSINLEDNSAHPNNHPSCCCDHGRAILDLRCIVDVIQLEMSKLQKQLDRYKSMLPPPGLATPLVPADGMAPPCGDVDQALLTIPSPLESRPPPPSK